MSKPSEKLIYRLAEKFCPGWETIASARSAVIASFKNADTILSAIEEELDN
jgi:hypothetical protein